MNFRLKVQQRCRSISCSFALKISCSFVFLCTGHLIAFAYGQTISLNLRNASLRSAIEAIKKQSGYELVLFQSNLQGAHPVTVNINGKSVTEAMDLITKDQPIAYELQGNSIVVRRKAEEPKKTQIIRQDKIINGKVLNQEGVVLSGVSILVKGTKKGTQTDENGRFSIDVADGDILVASFLGYQTKEVTVQSSGELEIRLAVLERSLDEVIVVGYGTTKKANLTGAVDQISRERLQNRPITNIAEGLQGTMANLNITTNSQGGRPGSQKAINIRGYTGLGTTGSPLILIDGVPADINAVNPADVASVTVLKDAASSAIYGSRAPYGVLLIETKKGKKDEPMSVTVNSNFRYNKPMNLPTMVNSLTFAEIINEAHTNAGSAPFYSAETIERIKAYLQDPENTPTYIPDPNNPSEWISGYTGASGNTDWFKAYMKETSPSQQHNVSMRGGSSKINYFIGLGTEQQHGMFNFYDDYHKRYNLRSNVEAHVTDWLSFGLKSSFAHRTTTQPLATSGIGNNWFHQIGRLFPNVPVTDPYGHYTRESNLLEFIYGGGVAEKTKDSWLTGDVTIKPLKGWEIKANYSYNYLAGEGSTLQLPFTYYNVANIPRQSNGGQSYLTKSARNDYYKTYNIYSSYEREIAGHSFKVLAGYQQEYQNFGTLTASNSNLYNFEQPSMALTYGQNYNAYDNLSAWATEGFFGRFNYNYKDRYLFEFNGRYDGSSRFPANRRYNFFPSFSAGYNIAKENYWQNLSKHISTFKLRGSYGKLGDQSSVGVYPYQTLLTTGARSSWMFSNGRNPFVSVGALTSDNITWAKPSMLDIGVDIGALNERLQLTADWYRRKTVDLFGPAEDLPSVIGIAPPQVNNAAIENKGIDLTVSWNDKIGKVGYNARVIFSRYSGKVLNYPNAAGLIGNWYNGKSMGEIWGLQSNGLFQSAEEIAAAPKQTFIHANWSPGDVRYADLNNDGQIHPGLYTLDDHGDLSIIGNSTPKFSYGFNFGVNWKGFDLNGFLQGVGRQDFWTTSNYYWGIVGSVWQSTILTSNLDRWTESTPDGFFPKYYMSTEMNKNMQTSSRYLLNAAYLRMKNLQLGYTLPKSLTGRYHIPMLRVYFSAENVFTVAPGMKGRFQVDPELLVGDSKIYPLQRSFSFGINLTIQ
ncbi:MAG: TonB-dependent receptor [Sphingobacterium sp.]|jgi:TonB-linked SusC/RagA family outer membrane protein|nr:TonB-dependent receptor [Sphingobacterium sp.]